MTYIGEALDAQIESEVSKQPIIDNEKVKDSNYLNQIRLTYGENKFNRTARQWCRLVDVFGIEKVCEQEMMTIEDVKSKCKLTMRQQINAKNRENRRAK